MTPFQLAITLLGFAGTATVFKLCLGWTWGRALTVFGGATAAGAIIGLILVALGIF
jgi:hypothetical protein